MLYIRGMRASHLFNLSVTIISNIKYVLLLFPAPAPLPGVSPPRLSSEDGLKALALAAGADRLAQFSCDVPVRQ